MTIGFPSRMVVSLTAFSCSALCVAGALALAPSPALARLGTGLPRPMAAQTPYLQRAGTQVRTRSDAPALPDVSALSWVVADSGTGEVLAAHDAHLKLPPASTLKTLFALTVLPALPAGIQHTVKEEELEGIGDGSSLVGVAAGHTYRVSDLWRGVFLNSGNDAVHVLAAMNGGWHRTAVRMQAKARSLGALDTHVESPDGYDTPGQVSSAYDLAVFGRAGLRNPEFARYCSTAQATFPGDGYPYQIQNTNRLLTGADGVAPYPGLIGVKNGYTTHAGNTLVAAAHRGGRTLLVTVMNPQAGGGTTVYEEARSLLDWGFAAAGHVEPVGSLPDSRPAPAAGASPVQARTGSAGGPDGGWPEAAGILGAAGLGAGGVALALRLKGVRATRD
ncbi:D-alanyl-D-alanine carboxypeptidase family protein [Streptomyces sp. NPDC127044]|nr:serine hydrolase [Streptomyces sp. WAC00263]KAF5992166.1 D-alanyl-D-alanine carboxypeptidase [Streptomyces sp. WAC00263]MCX4427945.1 D-alanyl-D-alanine carboxypeptidase [Streptomyces mirabilis]